MCFRLLTRLAALAHPRLRDRVEAHRELVPEETVVHATKTASADRCRSVDRRGTVPAGVGVVLPRRRLDRTSDASVAPVASPRGARLRAPDASPPRIRAAEPRQPTDAEIACDSPFVKRGSFRDPRRLLSVGTLRMLPSPRERGARDRRTPKDEPTAEWCLWHHPGTSARDMAFGRHLPGFRTSVHPTHRPGRTGETSRARPPFTRACHLFGGAFRGLI